MKHKIFGNRWQFIVFIFILLLILFRVFYSWLGTKLISSGDIHYFYESYLVELVTWPQAWGGEFRAPFLFSYPQHLLSGIFAVLGLPFNIVERLVWFWPSLVFSLFSSSLLFKQQFGKNKLWMITPLVYTTNTYFLMIAGGGQMGVALGYAIAPLTIWAWERLIGLRGGEAVRAGLVAGVVTAIQIAGDLRMTYVTMLVVGAIWGITRLRPDVRRDYGGQWGASLIALGTVVLLHAYWILPLLLSGRSSTQDLSTAYTSTNAVEFFSFADLPHTLSLLHPNWPENVFGKVSFFQPQFLVLTLFVMMSLWAVVKLKQGAGKVLGWFFVLLFGAILAAGTNSPSGGLYVWLFDNIPGFVMFRDPTKFYLLISLGYALLIPAALTELSKRFEKWWSIELIALVFVGFWAVLLWPVWRGEVRGTFVSNRVPDEYALLAKKLYSEERYFRTLWVPEKQRFAYCSESHPCFDGQLVSKTSGASGVLGWLKEYGNDDWLRRRSVKYLVVPTDTEGEIFITDRKYDDEIRRNLIQELDELNWLVKLEDLEPLVIYQITDLYPRVWMEDDNGGRSDLEYSFKSQSEIVVNIIIGDEGKRLVINEPFDAGWQYETKTGFQSGERTTDNLLSFKSIVGEGKIFYQPQKIMSIGSAISVATIAMIVLWQVWALGVNVIKR